jgi:L-alanine-DL-glutamate epimerase-like enolase superfamily enzyme
MDSTNGARGILSSAVVDLPPGDEGALITSVETYALAVPLVKTIADSTASIPAWIVPVVELHTADGRIGTGISGVHCGPELLCDVIDRYYAPALIGASSQDIVGTWKRLYWLPTHWIGRAGVVHMALGMVDIALWDLAAQRAGVPLWRLLGGSADAIETYNTDGGWLSLELEELIRDVSSLIDQGWRRVKMKVGKPDWREDVQRVRGVRRAIGDDVALMCDANQRWELATAARMLPVLEEVGMDWVEEPIHADDLDGHARLQRSTVSDIGAGISIWSAPSCQKRLPCSSSSRGHRTPSSSEVSFATPTWKDHRRQERRPQFGQTLGATGRCRALGDAARPDDRYGRVPSRSPVQ